MPSRGSPSRTDGVPAVSHPQKRSPLDEESPPPGTRSLLVEPLERFLHDCREKARLNQTILDFLLHQSFAGPDEFAGPESDLILAPEPDEATVRAVLGRYPFRDPLGAYQNLNQLAAEDVPFLSTRRCRHFLAGIAPDLLRAVAETPDPDLALVNLEKVTASLGAKAVLWELFRFNPPSLRLYVDLCASAPFLSEILITNPGMIDELLDSLVLNQPRTLGELRAELEELCRGATDPEPILHSFQDKELLRIGVRDILGKDDVRATTAALSDLAEAILGRLFAIQEERLARRWGAPPCRYAVLGLGKLGGREMSYHSDLDLLILYEGDGAGAGGTDPAEYFAELTRRAIKAASQMGPLGRLYEVDMRLRPAGKSGELALSLAEFRR
ncbi:MAG TPA: DUF294 nucleotidyltransferase-like domain-containing protein, partial [Gemmataceae bacterium]